MTNIKIKPREFLKERDNTGRLIVHMLDGTGKSYCVELIEPRTKDKNAKFGDIDPATKKITGSYGKKHKGAIKAEESMITKENGFEKIVEGPGGSYDWTVMQMHEKWKRENGFYE